MTTPHLDALALQTLCYHFLTVLLCLYPWPLKSYLALPDNVGFWMQRPVRNVLIKCSHTDGARLFSFTGEDYRWLTENREGHFKTILTATPDLSSQELTPYRYIYFRGGDPWIEGSIDLVRYTRLEPYFLIESIEDLQDPARFASIQSWVLATVQDFVDMYRLVSQEVDVIRPRFEDLVQTTVFVADRYNFTPAGAFEADFRPHQIRFAPPNVMVSGHGKGPLLGGEIDRFADLLRQGVRVSIAHQLFLDAKEQAHIGSQYDLAIVLVATSFEAFLREILSSTCEARGILTLPLRSGSTTADTDYNQAIEEGDTRRDLLRYVELLSGQSVKGGREYNSWYNDAYTPRNRIIHRGERGFTTDDAAKAFQATGEYIAFIRQKL